MINNATIELYRKAIKLWSLEFQVMMLSEEMAELTIAVNKRMRGKTIGVDNIIEELADVQIMMEQMMVSFNISEEEVRAEYMLKLEKMENMITNSLYTEQTKEGENVTKKV